MIVWREIATTYPDPDPREAVAYEATADEWHLGVIFDTSEGRWHWQAHHQGGTLYDGHADSLAAAQAAAQAAAIDFVGHEGSTQFPLVVQGIVL